MHIGMVCVREHTHISWYKYVKFKSDSDKIKSRRGDGNNI